MPRYEVEGGRAFRKSLRDAGDDLSDLKAAHRAAADIAARASADLAPVRTGRLKQTVRASGTKTAGIIRAGKKRVPYAGPIHWGWEKRGIRANPFLSNGARDSEGRWIPIYEHYRDEAIAKIKGL